MDEKLIAGKILFIGAHCDDIEIGCGGTAARCSYERWEIAFAIATDCGEERTKEAKAAAGLLGLTEPAGNLFLGTVKDDTLDVNRQALGVWIKEITDKFQPDTVFVHCDGDPHPDHQTLFNVVTRYLKKPMILLYVIPKPPPQVTPTPSQTVLRVEISSEHLATKLQLCAYHISQQHLAVYLSPERIRNRASEEYLNKHGTTGGFCEAFHIFSLGTGKRPTAGLLREAIPLTNGYVSPTGALRGLLQRLQSEQMADERAKKIIDELKRFSEPQEEVPVGLDRKLKDGGRHDLVDFATRAKEHFAKNLAQNTFFESAQEIHALFLSRIYTVFSTEISPQIKAGASRAVVDALIRRLIIEPVVAELQLTPFRYYDDHIYGMLYYLTGNCYVKWQ
jgi:LmbE family N-acetylglucosaminyl deacetylase